MSNEKLFFVKNGLLFCNTMFAKDGAEGEVLTDDNSAPSKSFYEIKHIIGANPSTLKGCSTIRLFNEASFTIQMKFSELSEIKKDYINQ